MRYGYAMLGGFHRRNDLKELCFVCLFLFIQDKRVWCTRRTVCNTQAERAGNSRGVFGAVLLGQVRKVPFEIDCSLPAKHKVTETRKVQPKNSKVALAACAII